MTLLGAGRFTYEVSGEEWGNLPEEWGYKEATGVAVDSKDNLYISNRGEHPMIVLDPEGNLIRTWGEGLFDDPHGVTIGPDDSVYCVDRDDHTVRKFTTEGKLMMTIGSEDHPSALMGGDPFNMPTHLAVDRRNGDLYVADGYSNARVHKFSPDGKLLFSWGESGTDAGSFNIPHNIAADNDGWVYVADRENRRIQVFDSNGKYETTWNDFAPAACVYVDHTPEQFVYVGEYFGGILTNSSGARLGPRITILDVKGTVLARLSDKPFGEEAGRFYAPHGIGVDSKGNLYVAEVGLTDFPRLYSDDVEVPPTLRTLQKLVRKD